MTAEQNDQSWTALHAAAQAGDVEAVRALLGIVFEEELYEPFYGERQFSIRDLNGFSLIFYTG